MAKVQFHPLFEALRGKIKGLVFRRSQSGKVTVYAAPDMTKVKWSAAQIAQRERLAEASAYATAALADPEIRPIYEQMAMERKNNKRLRDMAIKDYFAGNNLLGNKFNWDVEWWREKQHFKKRKKRWW